MNETQRSIGFLQFERVSVAPGQVVRVEATPQVLLRPEYLQCYVDETNARNASSPLVPQPPGHATSVGRSRARELLFNSTVCIWCGSRKIESLRVGGFNLSLLFVTGRPLWLPVARVGESYTIEVENNNPIAVNYDFCLSGECAR